MPCFSCKCFREGKDRLGNRLSGGRGYCVIWDQEYWRGHECRDFAPVWINPGQTGRGGDPMKEPGCFLSSACAEFMGLPDDCRELTALRAFRDNILLASPEGTALVNTYYQIAPGLVSKINASPTRREIYRHIYGQILLCISAIEEKEYEKAIGLYQDTVQYVIRATDG